jgi:xanthine/CO dehydrogenase XdhC/CoxF family maturation factor
MNSAPNALRLDTSLELLAERLATLNGPYVVATVISAAGSTYRKPGARMLVEGDGRITGLLSGGCFEQDLREHANKILSSGVARTVTYDMRADNDLLFGIGSGCEGCMGILLEPAHSSAAASSAILEASSMSHKGLSVALAAVYDAPEAERGTRLGTHIFARAWANLSRVHARALSISGSPSRLHGKMQVIRARPGSKW